MRKLRSALSNGSELVLGGVDKRLAWSRRLADLIGDHVSDLGGKANISAAELMLVKRTSMLTLQLEMLEVQFAEQDGMATSAQLNDYQRCLNTCRRTLESLGLERRQRDIGPTLGSILAEGIRRDREAEDIEEASA